MSTRVKVFVLFLIGVLATTLSLAAAGGAAPPHPAFDKMKVLVGTWQGKTLDGHPLEISFRLVSGGTALMSEMKTPDMPGHDMVTVIHPDAGHLMLTHYCSADNQPRMKSKGLSADGRSIDFAFVDATNLSGPDAMHMHHVTFTFKDADHYEEAWTPRVKGKDSDPWVFAMERKR